VITSLILSGYSPQLYPVVPSGSLYREFLICGGQVIFQMVIVLLISRHRLLHYIGNMMTVSLIGALLLLPLMILNGAAPVQPEFSLFWFAIVVTFMLFIHWRRVKWLEMSGWVTVSWVCSEGFLLLIA